MLNNNVGNWQDPHHGGVESQPCEVKRDFDPVVVANGVDRLELEHLLEGGPLGEEVVPHAAGSLQSALRGIDNKGRLHITSTKSYRQIVQNINLHTYS